MQRDVIDRFDAAIPVEDILTQRLQTITAAKLMEREFPPRTNFLSPWFPAQGLAMIYAPRGIGKTWVGLGLANAVASGGKFLSGYAPEPRRVVYIDGEMPGAVLQERLVAIKAGAEIEQPAEDYLQFIAADLHREGIPDLSTAEGQEQYEPLLVDADLLIVDNLSTVMRSGRENEAESWVPVQDWALRQRRAGKSVVFIHHAGKGGNQRGTSKREDILDTVISLRRPQDYEPEQGARFELHFEKARGITGDDVSPIEAFLKMHPDGSATWTYSKLEDVAMQRVVDLTAEGMSVRDIAAEMGDGFSRSKVNRLQAKARRDGLLDD